MAKYFTIDELIVSATASAEGIDNTPSVDAVRSLQYLADHTLDAVRELWGRPITVNSGYRSPKLNRRVRGAQNSQHMAGEAADITTGTAAGNLQLIDMIRRSSISFDQLIDENHGAWIHISCRYGGGGNRRQYLRL